MSKADLIWLGYYNELKIMFEKYGHCKVQKKYCDKKLYSWITRQQTYKKDGTLKPEREELLNNINFKFNNSWENMFNQFIEYFNKYNSFYIDKENEYYNILGKWLNKQLKLIQDNRLPSDKVLKFKNLNISISTSKKTLNETWMDSYALLKKIYIEKGTCTVPHTKEYKSLYRFVQTQRQNYKNNKLDKSKISLLKKIDFCFDSRLEKWLSMYNLACNYYSIHNNLNINPNDLEYKSLYTWLVSNRIKFKNGKLTEFQIKKLNELNFDFLNDAISKQWLNYFYKAKKIYIDSGHCSINPYEHSNKLFLWALEQVSNFKKGKLSIKQLNYLSEIEFDFSIKPPSKKERLWIENYLILKRFYKKYGHCYITTLNYNSPVYEWIRIQRLEKSTNCLSKEHEFYLNQINFK